VYGGLGRRYHDDVQFLVHDDHNLQHNVIDNVVHHVLDDVQYGINNKFHILFNDQ
jgi:hypothetical protein